MLEAAFRLRRAVFVGEQHIPPELERDAADETARHAVILRGKEALATGRVMIREASGRIGRVAVDRAWRRQGLGRQIMGALESVAREEGVSELELSSQLSVQGFYEQLGYARQGDVYVEADVEHIWMAKSLG